MMRSVQYSLFLLWNIHFYVYYWLHLYFVDVMTIILRCDSHTLNTYLKQALNDYYSVQLSIFRDSLKKLFWCRMVFLWMFYLLIKYVFPIFYFSVCYYVYWFVGKHMCYSIPSECHTHIGVIVNIYAWELCMINAVFDSVFVSQM